jgi:hypothetical protein
MADRKTYEVWISRDEMVDFLLYAASLDASVATRSKMSVEIVRNGAWGMLGLGVHTIDEGVEDRHGTVGDTGVWVDLLQN